MSIAEKLEAALAETQKDRNRQLAEEQQRHQWQPQPGERVLMECEYRRGADTGWPIVRLDDGLIVATPISSLRPLPQPPERSV